MGMIIEKPLFYAETEFGKIEFKEGFLESGEKFTERLYLDDGLQWDKRDEYRYHHSLFALPILCLTQEKINVLVLGGGDGLGVRDLLRFGNNIESITLVDISKEMLFLAQNNKYFIEINKNSLNNPKVNVINKDSKIFIEEALKENKQYDLIILDYPDPNDENVNHPVNFLFTAPHYNEIKKLLKEEGICALQATSSYIFPNTYKKIQLELLKVFPKIQQVKIAVNSYGDIGIIFAKKTKENFKIFKPIPEWTFFNEQSVECLFKFFRDEFAIYPDEALENLSIAEIFTFDKQKPVMFLPAQS
jgi:spermidine synthase